MLAESDPRIQTSTGTKQESTTSTVHPRQTGPCGDNFQRWRVVHAIACHAHSVAELTETLNNQILVVRVCLRKTISSQEPVTIVSAQVCRLLLGFLVQEMQTVVM